MRKSIDFPIVSIAAVITVKKGVCLDARIVMGAVAPKPIRIKASEAAIKGKAINVETAEAAATAAVIDAVPLIKNAYKVEIIKNLVKKAILSMDSGESLGRSD